MQKCDVFWVVSYCYGEGRGKLNLKKFDQMKVFSQEKRTRLSAAHLPWQGIWEAAGRAVRVFLVQVLPGAQGRTSTWTEQSGGTGVTRAVPPCHWPIMVTLPNTKLAFTSHSFCSLISSSGSFQPGEISLQVPALNPLTTVTLSVFPELWKSQRICCKAPSLQMRMSGLTWRESRNSPKEIPSRYMVVLEKNTNQTQISCWNSDA